MTSALPPLHVGGDRQATNLHGRNFLKELDFTADEFLSLIHLSAFLKADKRAGCEVRHLTGKNIALIFEKTSTRTRAAFEVAAHDQGAHVTYRRPGLERAHRSMAPDPDGGRHPDHARALRQAPDGDHVLLYGRCP